MTQSSFGIMAAPPERARGRCRWLRQQARVSGADRHQLTVGADRLPNASPTAVTLMNKASEMASGVLAMPADRSSDAFAKTAASGCKPSSPFTAADSQPPDAVGMAPWEPSAPGKKHGVSHTNLKRKERRAAVPGHPRDQPGTSGRPLTGLRRSPDAYDGGTVYAGSRVLRRDLAQWHDR